MLERLKFLGRQTDILFTLGVVGIIVMMVMPVHHVIMDILLAFSITASLIVLLLTIYVKEPLQFSVFPSILLILTLFRLALNIASTRLILINGHTGPAAAGRVIESFGQFVVSGNYVVGIIVFLILVIINFIVITKGAGRIAEVAARFVLDSMPGKQMSIDADLNAGIIKESEARARRRGIEDEADFYGRYGRCQQVRARRRHRRPAHHRHQHHRRLHHRRRAARLAPSEKRRPPTRF